MPTFYFTYGTDEQFPFKGGWTEITAPNLYDAQKIFKIFHPNNANTDCLNCAFFYTEESFKESIMYKNNDNLGKGCVEKITINRELFVVPRDME